MTSTPSSMRHREK